MENRLVAAVTIDLESDYGGRVPWGYSAWQPDRIRKLLTYLHREKVPLTAFVVGKTLKDQPRLISLFAAHGTEFHLHSYSHNPGEPDSEEEITKGRGAYTRYFGTYPVGYKAPEGRITEEGWRRLAKSGFRFDASVYPSFWPHPMYLRYPRDPFRVHGNGLISIPFATVARLIVSVSWINLLGWNLYEQLLSLFPLPRVFVFNMHLHDLWDTSSRLKLPFFWRMVYRKSEGIAALEHMVSLLKKKGYRFVTMNDVVSDHFNHTGPAPRVSHSSLQFSRKMNKNAPSSRSRSEVKIRRGTPSLGSPV